MKLGLVSTSREVPAWTEAFERIGHRVVNLRGWDIGTIKRECDVALVIQQEFSPSPDLCNGLHAAGVPLFTNGNDANAQLDIITEVVDSAASAGRTIPYIEHPLTRGWDELPNSGADWRRLIFGVAEGAKIIAIDEKLNSVEVIALDRPARWVHYHPYPLPPDVFLANCINWLSPTLAAKPPIVPKLVIAGLVGTILYAFLRKSRK